jgi:ATP-dependent Clp protease adaptor protein ClpS
MFALPGKNMMPVRENSGFTFAVKPKRKEKMQEPPEYRVVLLNDDYTTQDFVVEILVMVFHKNEVEANRIMMDVHRKGRGIVGVYTRDIAQTKVNQVHELAVQAEFPLRCIVEKA